MQNEKREKPRKVDSRKLAVRIIAWVLILMTVVTTLYTAIYFIIEEVNAAEVDELNIAVGLVYGDSVDESFTTTTIVGYTVGSEKLELYKKSFTPIWTIPNTKKITVLTDTNFSKTVSNTYYPSDAGVNVGAYHLELASVYADTAALTDAIEKVNAALDGTADYAIPSFISNEIKIRVGQYSTKEKAEAALNGVAALLPDETLTVVSPSKTGVTVVEHTTAKILFEYDCGNDSYLGLEPIDEAVGKETYTATPAGNTYDGVFVYKRYVSTKGTDGLQLTNVLPIEEYLLGVIPYEVSNSWPNETLKAFAVLARTYAVAEIDQFWKSYGFNVGNTTASQVYKGAGRANDNVRSAVTETKGLVLTYNGELAPTYYSSSVGDSTADSRYMWGQQDLPWLRSVWTPWEDYKAHANAFWTTEVSPSDLQKYLNDNGYTSLTAPIASVTVNENAGDNSNYVYKVTVKDEKGNSVVITKADKVKSAFSKYTYSSNFVVGKGSVTHTTYKQLLTPEQFKTANDGTFSVLTSLGKLASSFKTGVDVITSGGKVSFLPTSSVTVLTGDSYKNGVSESIRLEEYSTDHLTTETVYAKDKNNFIFVGKGWGHGLGLSQWGLHDLAGLGVECEEMLLAYCTGTSLTDYKELIGEQLISEVADETVAATKTKTKAE